MVASNMVAAKMKVAPEHFFALKVQQFLVEVYLDIFLLECRKNSDLGNFESPLGYFKAH